MQDTWIYILRCSDGKYYTGTYRGKEIETRVSEHNLGLYPKAYTFKRRPVELLWAETYQYADDAIVMERRIKGWTRAKKEALIRGDWDGLQDLASRKKPKDGT